MHLRFSRLILGILLLNLFIIVWGGLVRATGSGAGCGSHWPACNGEIIPLSGSTKTLIEYTHRLTSLLGLIGVGVIFLLTTRYYQKKSEQRRWAGAGLFFMIVEALIGAALVIFGLVDKNETIARAVVMSFHLINTCLLMGSLAKLYWIVRFDWEEVHPIRVPYSCWIGVFLIVLAITGAIAALGDTLFPAETFLQGWQQELSPTSHILVRLRLYHPFLAVGIGIFIIWVIYFYELRGMSRSLKIWGRTFAMLYVFQLFLGLVNVGLLAPIWMQMIHLLFSNLVWLSFILWSCSVHWSPEKFYLSQKVKLTIS